GGGTARGMVDDVGELEPPRARRARRFTGIPEDLGREQVRSTAEVPVRNVLRLLDEPRDPAVADLDRVVLADELDVVRLAHGADGGVAAGDVAQRRVVRLEIELVAEDED